ncbi:MAG: hypothetical protein AAB885_03235, partial [Patescibacteria group bacterium]
VGCQNDRITPTYLAKDLHTKYNVHDRAELKIFPRFAHCVQLEPGWEKPAEEIMSWISEKIK